MPNDELYRRTVIPGMDAETLEQVHKASKEYDKLMAHYRCAMMEVRTRFEVLNEEHILEYGTAPINSIKTRLKSLASLQEKMRRRNIPFTLELMERQLDDIAGVRVICSFPEDVYAMEKAFLGQNDVVLLLRKDYIANPKPNGYRSLHLIVAVPVYLSSGKRMTKVEIQLRTIAMDFWASLEHQLRYKRENTFTDEMAAELYECAQLSAALDNRMDALRKSVNLHNDPDGEHTQ